MTITEIRNNAKNAVIETLGLTSGTQTEATTFVFDSGLETLDGAPQMVKVAVTACNMEGTKTVAPFSLENAVAAYAEKVAEREEKEAEKAANKAAKAAKAEERKQAAEARKAAAEADSE